MKKQFIFVTTIVLSSVIAVVGYDDLFIESSAQEASESGDVAAASGSNRFVVWQDLTPGNFDIFFKRSTDNGATWKPVVNLSKNPVDSIAPQVVVSGTNVYVAWVQSNSTNSDVFFRRSTDNGATWKPVVNLSNNPNKSLSDIVNIAVSGSKIYVAWDDDSCLSGICFFQHDVKFRRSTDNGATWKPVVNLSNTVDTSVHRQVIASGANVYVAWLERTSTNDEVFFRRSTDNGATWKPVVNLSNNPNESLSAEVRIAVSGSKIYVAWDDDSCLSGICFFQHDVKFRRSTDNGATWKPVVNLSGSTTASGIGAIAATGSSVYVTWQESDPTPQNDVFFRRSTDNGATWKQPVNLNGDVKGSRSPQIAVSGPNVYVIWVGSALGAKVFLSRSTDSGATMQPTVPLSASSSFIRSQQISIVGANVYVVWDTGGSGNNEIFLRRSTDNGSNWKSILNLSNNPAQSRLPQIAG